LSNEQRGLHEYFTNVVKSLGGRGSAPDPAGGAYSTSPDCLAVGEGRLVAFGHSFHTL